jgi:hypothetical protein
MEHRVHGTLLLAVTNNTIGIRLFIYRSTQEGVDFQIHQFHQNIWVGLWIGWQKMLMGLIALHRVAPKAIVRQCDHLDMWLLSE